MEILNLIVIISYTLFISLIPSYLKPLFQFKNIEICPIQCTCGGSSSKNSCSANIRCSVRYRTHCASHACFSGLSAPARLARSVGIFGNSCLAFLLPFLFRIHRHCSWQTCQAGLSFWRSKNFLSFSSQYTLIEGIAASASTSRLGVARYAPVIFRRHAACARSSSRSTVPLFPGSCHAPYVSAVRIHAVYKTRARYSVGPQVVWLSLLSAVSAMAPFSRTTFACAFQLSFVSSQTPSTRTLGDGAHSVPCPSWIVAARLNLFRALVK
jgi:hypothetical protein